MSNTTTDTITTILDPVSRLTKDLRDASIVLSADEVRFLVDAYYSMQRDRIRAGNQLRALSESEEPHSVMSWLGEQRAVLEKQVARALDAYSGGNPAGIWARSITGIGPIIAAGLLAHIDIHEAPTAGHIWRYAGLDPTSEWLGNERAAKLIDTAINNLAEIKTTGTRGRQPEVTPNLIVALASLLNMRAERIMERLVDEKTGKHVMTRKALTAVLAKRPWNASLKRLCFLIGESFVKVSNLESDVYGKVYMERKLYEQAKNDKGDYADQAIKSLSSKNYGADTDARTWYEGCYPAGTTARMALLEPTKRAAYLTSVRLAPGKGVQMLPPARIHRRACRYAVKLFISHLHHVMYEQTFGKLPPKPYIIEHGGHTDFLAPPNWPMK